MTLPAMYLCVHVPEFAAQVLLRLRPERRRCAVAVLEGVAPLERVCSVNRLAAEMGVRAGMTRAELDSFDGLEVLRRSAAEERVARSAVLEVAGAFTPRVEDLTERADAGACVVVLDVSGTGRLFGPLERLARRIVGSLGELGLVARVAVSGNVWTAVVVARSLAPRGGVVRMVARGAEAAELATLPMAALRLTEEQAETFGMWGLRTVGELATLPEVEVVVRLGQEGGRLWRLARGCAEHLMVPVEAGLRLEEVMAFDAPVEEMESLMFVMGPMLDQLIARAGNRALELASVRVEMGLDEHGGGEEGDGGSGCGGEHVRVIKPALPMADRRLYLKLLQLDLEAHAPTTGVVRLRMTAEAGSRGKAQAGLFSAPLPEAGRLEVTLARLAGLVGERWVGSARLRDSHGPESFAMERFRLPEVEEARRRGGGRAREDRLRWQRGEMERRRAQAEKAAAAEQTKKVTHIVIKAADGPEVEQRQWAGSKVLQFTVLRRDAEIDVAAGGTAIAGVVDEAAGGWSVTVRRMRPPVPIRWRDERETAFWMQGVLHEVRERYGPWRRSGAWWTGAVWSQEECDAVVEAGGSVRLLCVLTHDLLRDVWHLDAVYD